MYSHLSMVCKFRNDEDSEEGATMDAASACASSDLSELTSLAGEPDPTALAALLAQRGRNAFLAALKERGIGLADRSAIADAIAAATRNGRLSWQPSLGA